MGPGLRAVAVLTVSIAVAACSSGGGPAGPAATSTPTALPSVPATSPSEVSPMPSSASSAPVPSTPSPSPTPRFTLTSTAFAAGEAIPRRYTCDGSDDSPPLAWTGVPAGTKALVLVVDDPDAGDFVHWIVLDQPGSDGALAMGVNPDAATPQQGTNDFGRRGWGGPCPPSGTHHYRFSLTALGAPLALAGHPGGAEVRRALKGAQVVGEARLTATYRRG